MRAAISLRNIIGIAEDIFLKAIIPLECYLNTSAVVSIGTKMHNLIYRTLIGIKEFNKGAKAAIIGEFFLFSRALIMKNDADT